MLLEYFDQFDSFNHDTELTNCCIDTIPTINYLNYLKLEDRVRTGPRDLTPAKKKGSLSRWIHVVPIESLKPINLSGSYGGSVYLSLS